MQHTAIDGTAKKRRAALWALCTALAVLCAVAVTYYWRVFYAYTAVPAVPLALCAAALALCGAVAGGFLPSSVRGAVSIGVFGE